MLNCEAALQRLCSPDHDVSAHYLISEHGNVFALVDEDMRAWHAGAGRWGDCGDINSRSVGIELANRGTHPFAAAQMDALAVLLREVMARHRIKPARVIGHSDMAPGRKHDPGTKFDWRRLAMARLAVWPEPRGANAAPDANAFRRDAARFGYTATEDAALLLHSVRLRFRPWATGELDAQDMALIADLAHRFPVDASPVRA